MEVTSAEKPNPAPPPREKKERDFLHHVESFLSRRDGVDKLLKIARYAAKIVLSTSSSLPENQTLTLTLIPRLKSFESSVGLSRKAFRLGKFVQDVNSLRSAVGSSRQKTDLLLAIVAYGGEGLYYFVEQLVWLSKTGLIPAEKSKLYAKISAWAELVGYIGSISIKVRELDLIRSELESRKDGDEELRRKLKEKMAMKWLSVIQDLADGLMALGDVRDGKGAMTGPTLMASAGMLSAMISAQKNWNSC